PGRALPRRPTVYAEPSGGRRRRPGDLPPGVPELPPVQSRHELSRVALHNPEKRVPEPGANPGPGGAGSGDRGLGPGGDGRRHARRRQPRGTAPPNRAPRRRRSRARGAAARVPGGCHARGHRGADVPRGGRGDRQPDRHCHVPAVAGPGASSPGPGPFRPRARLREGGGMTCAEVRARLHAYVDGELTVSHMTELDGHCVECREGAADVAAERELRQLLRRQPRDAAPPELRARILRRMRREAAVATARRWLPVPALAAAAIVAALLLAARTPPPLIADLVDKHIAYAQLQRPGELGASGPRAG